MGQLGYGKMGGIDGWDWSFWFELVVKLGCGVAKECRNLDVCIKQRLKRHVSLRKKAVYINDFQISFKVTV